VSTTSNFSYNNENSTFFMSFNFSLPPNKKPVIHCGRRLRALIQARCVLCELRIERHVDLLVFKVLMPLEPPAL